MGNPKPLTPRPRTPYGPGPWTTLRTGPWTTPTTPSTDHPKIMLSNRLLVWVKF